jgi:hypothetical protein
LAQFIIGPNGVDGMEFARVLRIDYGEWVTEPDIRLFEKSRL